MPPSFIPTPLRESPELELTSLQVFAGTQDLALNLALGLSRVAKGPFLMTSPMSVVQGVQLRVS